jgi:hypothetical protein
VPSRPAVTPADADEPETTARPAPRSDLSILGYLGLGVLPEISPRHGTTSLSLGVSTLCRWRMLGFGVFGELSHAVAGGGMAGLAWRSSGGFRAELLGTAGGRYYQVWEQVSVPFAGLTGRLGYIFGRNQRGHFNLGGMASVGWDLARVRKNVPDDSFRAYYYYGGRGTERVGGTNYVFALTLGATIDLAR